MKKFWESKEIGHEGFIRKLTPAQLFVNTANLHCNILQQQRCHLLSVVTHWFRYLY